MPKGVIAQPDGIKLDVLLAQVVEEPASGIPVSATVNVNQDGWRRNAGGLLDPADSGFKELSKLPPLVLIDTFSFE